MELKCISQLNKFTRGIMHQINLGLNYELGNRTCMSMPRVYRKVGAQNAEPLNTIQKLGFMKAHPKYVN